MTRAPAREQPDTDEALLARVGEGEVALFAVLMRRHNQRLFRTVRGLLRDDGEAEDVLQQTYLAAYRAARTFRGDAKVSTWLTRIAINEALARIKRRKRQLELTVVEDDETMNQHPTGARNPEEDASAQELTRLLERAIDELPDNYRVVFVLREIEELSSAEVAACLELSEEAVRVRLFRARAMLRDTIDRRLGEAADQVYGFAGARCDRIVAVVMAAIAS